MEKVFWLLWNPQGQNPPTFKFSTYEAAVRQADVMQRKIGIGTMYVLKAVRSITVSQKVKSEGLKEN